MKRSQANIYQNAWWFLPACLCWVLLAHADSDYEQRLVQTLDRIQKSDLEAAVRDVKGLVSEYQNSRLSKLIYGDLLMAMTGPIHTLGGSVGGLQNKNVQELREEALVRWKHQRGNVFAYQGRVPANLLHLGNHKYAALVDLSGSRIYVYENRDGLPHLVSNYYVSIGLNGAGKEKQGDQRTPIGVYHITSFLPGSGLPDRYGPGAFPIDYPNTLDRRHKRTGYGIWLHGSPSDTYNRGPKASDGCVALSNPDFRALQKIIQSDVGTPVVIADKVEWITPQELQSRRVEVMSQIDRWRLDWESLDTDKYLSHYSRREFLGSGKDYTTWARHKRRVNSNKSFVQVRLDVLGLFEYPGETGLLSVEFDQRYLSDNYQGRLRKQQYWRKDGTGNWRIVYEGRG